MIESRSVVARDKGPEYGIEYKGTQENFLA